VWFSVADYQQWKLDRSGTIRMGEQWRTLLLTTCKNTAYDTKYDELDDAKTACLRMGKACAGVYSPGCDPYFKFRLCQDRPFEASTDACVYTRTSRAPVLPALRDACVPQSSHAPHTCLHRGSRRRPRRR
jgi:hypothetical protein